jgi:hypothetical protein
MAGPNVLTGFIDAPVVSLHMKMKTLQYANDV